jgi:hypothetical protein
MNHAEFFILLFVCLVWAGRDGLTHNMLDNIHAHWKRRRVCKIKCKGVCTVDMDNVCQQLEVWLFFFTFNLVFDSIVCFGIIYVL